MSGKMWVSGLLVATSVGALAAWSAVPNRGAMPETTITEDDFWAAVQNNANLVGDCYAMVDLDCSFDDYDFVDGFMAAKGTSKFHLNHGSRGTAIWHNELAMNHYSPALGRRAGLNAQGGKGVRNLLLTGTGRLITVSPHGTSIKSSDWRDGISRLESRERPRTHLPQRRRL